MVVFFNEVVQSVPQVTVTMAARLSARNILLRFPVSRSCSAQVHRTRACSAGLSANGCHMSGVRTLSGVQPLSGFGSWSNPGVRWGTRSLSGGGAERGSDWYSSLSDTAPVHLCEELLVGLQQVSGLPWWMNIVASTVLVRTAVTLPLAAYQVVVLARVSTAGLEVPCVNRTREPVDLPVETNSTRLLVAVGGLGL